ncbi:MAG TPA: hypothetical protein VF285_07640 [Castellaniella sp.]|uniref:hypothetical protein n=1 Tax=Castellaniella sp. TaxID=1955812 RepID=UPI002EEFB050
MKATVMRAVSVRRTFSTLLATGTLLALPVTAYCADPDLASPEGVMAVTTQVGVQNDAYISQRGASKTATIAQTGGLNMATITQTGLNEAAIATQYGSGNVAGIIQAGVNDVAAVRQYGVGNDAFVGQFGNNLMASVNQVGLLNKAVVIQLTPGLPVQTVNQVGIGRTSLVIR